MSDIKVRTKFPLVEPEKPVEPPRPKTLEEVNAMILRDLDRLGIKAPEKCAGCDKLGLCATLFLLGITPEDPPPR